MKIGISKVTILQFNRCFPTMEKPVYNRIKAVLAERRRTNYWLADQLKVNRTTVSKWCRNEMQPRVETLFHIAKVLEVDVRELLVSK
jgi:DNA-binding XRE family transcriptional regulator